MKEKKQLSNAEIASFCSQIALLLDAGISPADSVNIILNNTSEPSAKKLLTQIRDICQKGDSFHKALAATGMFPDYVVHTIALGEESGKMDDCMESLATYYEKGESIAENIKSAITYPFVMIVMMLAVIFVLISKVMPIFNQVFIELGSEMTGFAASLLQLGTTLNRYSILLLIMISMLFIFYLLFTKTKWGRRCANAFFNTTPLTKGFYEDVACERFANGMALSLSSGMDTFTSLDMVSDLVGNKLMQSKIAVCKKAIQGGASFPEAVANSGIFNNLYSQMIAVGFKSGRMDTVLTKIADNYEKATDKKIQSIISILEPTLVIILSVIVGMILLSVILPLIGIMTSIG